MKTPQKYFAAIAALLIFSVSAIPAKAGSFAIGTNQFDFAWEDATLSSNVRVRINQMLLNTLADWTNANIDLAPDSISGSIRFWELGHPPFLPRVGLPNQFASTGTNGIYAIDIPKPFSDACKDAFAWCDANSELVSSGEQFVSSLSPLAEDLDGTNNLAAAFYSPDLSEETMANARGSLLEILRGKVYRNPVELSFGVWAGDDDVPDGVPAMLIPFREENVGASGSSMINNDTMPALLIDGQWRIYLWKP